MLKQLISTFTNIQTEAEMELFFKEIFTPNELDDFALRWRLLNELYKGTTQRKIASDYHISLCKITRGSKILKNENTKTYQILKNLHGEQNNDTSNSNNATA